MFIGLKSHCPVQGNHPEAVRSEPRNSRPPREPRPSRSPVYQGRGDKMHKLDSRYELKSILWIECVLVSTHLKKIAPKNRSIWNYEKNTRNHHGSNSTWIPPNKLAIPYSNFAMAPQTPPALDLEVAPEGQWVRGPPEIRIRSARVSTLMKWEMFMRCQWWKLWT